MTDRELNRVEALIARGLLVDLTKGGSLYLRRYNLNGIEGWAASWADGRTKKSTREDDGDGTAWESLIRLLARTPIMGDD